MGWPSSWRGTARSRGLAGRATGDYSVVFVVPPWDHSAVFVVPPWGKRQNSEHNGSDTEILREK